MLTIHYIYIVNIIMHLCVCHGIYVLFSFSNDSIHVNPIMVSIDFYI